MGLPAARITDMHLCPMVTGIVPHVGGPIIPPCAVTVLIGGLPAARITDLATCVGPIDMIAKGSTGVFISGLPAARILDNTVHGGVIITGHWTTLIGDTYGGGGGGAVGAPAPADATTSKEPEATPAETPQLTQTDKDTLQAKADAVAILEQAKKDLETWDEATKARAKKWFGSDDDTVRDKMKDRVDKSIKKLNSFDQTNFSDPEPGKGKGYAYVYPTKDDKIYRGALFQGAPATGSDSKAGILVHEVSHFDSVGGTRDMTMSDGKIAYGKERCEKLAKENPTAAQKNADSFEYFVENQ